MKPESDLYETLFESDLYKTLSNLICIESDLYETLF
jgi:hypothetical protein